MFWSLKMAKWFSKKATAWRICDRTYPNAPDTKFRLGSITKQFTAMLVMQLVEKGKIKVNDKIATYLPDYPKANSNKIAVHHLLTHTSGIPNYTNFPKFFENLSRDLFIHRRFF